MQHSRGNIGSVWDEDWGVKKNKEVVKGRKKKRKERDPAGAEFRLTLTTDKQ